MSYTFFWKLLLSRFSVRLEISCKASAAILTSEVFSISESDLIDSSTFEGRERCCCMERLSRLFLWITESVATSASSPENNSGGSEMRFIDTYASMEM